MSSDNTKIGRMDVRLVSYLRRLRAIERRKPKEQRRKVPTMKELSEVANVDISSLSRFANGHTRSLNFDIVVPIMTEMWRRGFQIKIVDILKFEPPEELKANSIGINDDPWGPLPPWASAPPPLTRRQHRKYPGEEFVKAYAEEEATVEAMVEDPASYGTGAVS